jgi:hypothetical protein
METSVTKADVEMSEIAIESVPEPSGVSADFPVKSRPAVTLSEAELSPPPVSYWSLYRYATGGELTLVFLGVVCSIANGAALPVSGAAAAVRPSQFEPQFCDRCCRASRCCSACSWTP